MNNQKPIAILTDGDQAMRRAIEAVLPGCPHRLCTWHVSKNARNHLRYNQALSEFRRCMWEEVTPYGFERRWTAMVNRHKLHNKDWVNIMYEKRHLWAEAFVSGHFFARMRSTQRCEGMHSYMKPYLKSGVKLFELVPALDRGLLRLRFKGVLEDFKSNNSTHVLTSSLQNLEHHAGYMSSLNKITLLFVQLKTLDIMFEDEIYIFFHERWLFSSFKIFRPSCVPIQPNDFDCGIYIIKFMEEFENASKAGDKFDSETERLRIATKLVKHPDNQALVAIDKAIEDQQAEDRTTKLPKKKEEKTRGHSTNR
ncbi:hypothetical protein ACLB2K_011781 [Fragaria x ananassa]